MKKFFAALMLMLTFVLSFEALAAVRQSYTIEQNEISNLFEGCVIIRSQKPKVATVIDGCAQGVKTGKTKIKALYNGVEKVITLNVVKQGKGVRQVMLNKSQICVEAGKTAQLKCSFVPKKPKDKSLIYESSNNSVVTVSKKGKITARQVGTATITVTASSGATSKCEVNVTPAMPSKIKLAKKA